MTRFLFALLALGLLGAVPHASAGCRWFGSQLDCEVGGSQLVIGTQAVAAPTSPGILGQQPLQGGVGLLEDRAFPEWSFRVNLQNVGRNPGDCRKFGNETYCY